jgi:molybdenum cofactor cytidylyltransferase
VRPDPDVAVAPRVEGIADPGRVDAGHLLADALDLGERELVAFVGAGGKTTLLRALGFALVRRGRRVLLTTTTRVGAAQMADWPLFWAAREENGKVVGPAPDAVDAAYASGSQDLILVEADGAKGRMVKAPADYEPVVPSRSTLVVAVFPEAALGKAIDRIAHRPERVATVLRCGIGAHMTPVRAARLIGSREGYRKAVPSGARFVVVIRRDAPDPSPDGADLVRRLRSAGIHAVELELPIPEPLSSRARPPRPRPSGA